MVLAALGCFDVTLFFLVTAATDYHSDMNKRWFSDLVETLAT